MNEVVGEHEVAAGQILEDKTGVKFRGGGGGRTRTRRRRKMGQSTCEVCYSVDVEGVALGCEKNKKQGRYSL